MRDGSGRLTAKQKRFIEVFDGNATKAARIAGYANPNECGRRCINHPEIAAAIRAREDANLAPDIATREERQAFWSATMRDAEQEMKDRLRASELLGKSNADFIDRLQQDGQIEINVKIVTYANKD